MPRSAKVVDTAPIRLAASIRGMLAVRRPKPYEPLLSYQKLAKRYGVSISTVQEAMALLEGERLICRMKGRGTFYRPEGAAAEAPAAVGQLRCVNVLFLEFWEGEVLRVGHTESLAGCTEALDQSHARLRVVTLRNGDYDSILMPMLRADEQGCVLMHAYDKPDLMTWLRDRNVPFVLASHKAYRRTGLPPHHSVFANKIKGAFDAARHLLDLGHRRIGFIGTQQTPLGESEVFEGFRSALACHGAFLDPADYVEFHTDELPQAMQVAQDYLRRPSLPTAVVAETDAMALALLAAARAAGVRVPEALSVVGFNDLPAAANSLPPLTTVQEPWRLLARSATETLLRVAETPAAPWEDVALPCRLVVRESSAAPNRT